MFELSSAEIDMVTGAGGFFENVGNALDNPWTTAGKVIDGAVKIGRKIISGEIHGGPLPYYGSH